MLSTYCAIKVQIVVIYNYREKKNTGPTVTYLRANLYPLVYSCHSASGSAFFLIRNIGQVTPKNIYHHYLKRIITGSKYPGKKIILKTKAQASGHRARFWKHSCVYDNIFYNVQRDSPDASTTFHFLVCTFQRASGQCSCSLK